MAELNPDQEWQRYGEEDPYYGVVSIDKFHRDRLDPSVITEFFESGEHHMEYVFETIREYVEVDFHPSRALDFGCGVGRCLFPLAARCEKAVGVDVSSAMLAEAERNAKERGIENIELVASDDVLTGVEGPFDFIHSFIVFQHIPPRRGEQLLRELISRLSEGGVGSIQLIYDRKISAAKRALGALRRKSRLLNGLANLANGAPFGKPLMEKNCYNLNRVMNLLRDSGCPHLHVAFEGEGQIRSLVLFFQKDSDAGVYDYEAFFKKASGSGDSGSA